MAQRRWSPDPGATLVRVTDRSVHVPLLSGDAHGSRRESAGGGGRRTGTATRREVGVAVRDGSRRAPAPAPPAPRVRRPVLLFPWTGRVARGRARAPLAPRGHWRPRYRREGSASVARGSGRWGSRSLDTHLSGVARVPPASTEAGPPSQPAGRSLPWSRWVLSAGREEGAGASEEVPLWGHATRAPLRGVRAPGLLFGPGHLLLTTVGSDRDASGSVPYPKRPACLSNPFGLKQRKGSQ